MTTIEPLHHVESWIFDLDNTLYPASCDLFSQVDRRMGEFICRELALDAVAARALQKQYFREHGTTLRGLMTVHGIDPAVFLDYVHDIDLAPVAASRALDDALGRLEGRKLIFTNGSVAHAERILEKIGIARHFDDMVDIVASDYVPKPDPATYDRMVTRFGIEPARAAMVEDIARNLVPARALGMTTVWLRGGNDDWAHPEDDDDPADHIIDDLEVWLTGVADARERLATA